MNPSIRYMNNITMMPLIDWSIPYHDVSETDVFIVEANLTQSRRVRQFNAVKENSWAAVHISGTRKGLGRCNSRACMSPIL